ncbi:hypothetical protein PGT21_014207 [Puccinia graminis f. sp. tritici]|uniref:Uncharacterized protein n=1 Tax=Puccinia graminis f. sp. tritici TaxID=56615 RepID=A0A5B0QMS2_PUCGR|nr:hypothetical protein PGT21_014207 [Puccinia graminis f. sp. tritici]
MSHFKEIPRIGIELGSHTPSTTDPRDIKARSVPEIKLKAPSGKSLEYGGLGLVVATEEGLPTVNYPENRYLSAAYLSLAPEGIVNKPKTWAPLSPPFQLPKPNQTHRQV